MKKELKPLVSGEIRGIERSVPGKTDILIVGGGLVGNAVAYFLKEQANMYDVMIVERDYSVS